MKIAQVVCVYPPYKGGIGNVAFKYTELLKKHGHNVTVFAPRYNNDLKNSNSVEYLKPFLKLGNAAFIPSLIWKLKNFDFIVLHYPFFGGAESVFLAKFFNKKIKIIIQYHMDVVFDNYFLKFLSIPSFLVKKYLFQNSEKIISASLNYIEQSQIKKIYQKNKDKFIEIPFGVDEKRFFPVSFKKQNKKKILFVSSLDKAHYFKGLKFLLKAFDSIDNENFELHIVGGGDLLEYYKNIAKKLKSHHRIIFQGRLSDADLVKAYQDADLFVLPSINKGEAFGLVLLEAMASGLPVIASDLAGVDSVFEDGKQGFYVKPGDLNQLSSKIKKVLENDELRKKMSLQSLELVLEKYSWESVGEKLSKYF